VPATATILAECRSLNHEKAIALSEEMKNIINSEVINYGAIAEVKIDNLCKAVNIPEDSWSVLTSKKALEKAGVHATTTFITGFTDASIYNNHGIEIAVVGIGARLEHSLDEHIYVEDMKKALVMIVELLRLSSE
jgi:tripeptide aminopeptidase